MIGQEVEVSNKSFYNGMTGKIAEEIDEYYLVEIKLNAFYGGLHRVMLCKDEVIRVS